MSDDKYIPNVDPSELGQKIKPKSTKRLKVMVQTKEQTDKEKLEMYMKLPKWRLIQMLISANNHIDNLGRLYVDESISEEGIKWAKEKIEEKYY